MVLQDIGIYISGGESRFFHHHLRRSLGPISQTWSYYVNGADLVASQHQRKIVCIKVPYPYDDTIEAVIDQLYDSVDCIICIASEVHEVVVNFMRRYDRPKIEYFICGRLNPPLEHSKTHLFLDWFITSTHFYKDIKPSILYQLRPHEPKPYVFDALLGRKKLHRDRVYNFIKTKGLSDQCVMTYMNGEDHGSFTADTPEQWLWEDEGLSNHEQVTWTVNPVNYYGHTMSLSQVMPLTVYNQTAYSLVCETNCDQDYVFFTEKTVKPILARRLFVLVANRYSLAMLRDLGFKTFDSIIDESYDSMEMIYGRQMAAMAQIKWLCEQDQATVLEQCRDIVNYNYDLMYGTDWYEKFKTPFVAALLGR
jgi:hypothetical protein